MKARGHGELAASASDSSDRSTSLHQRSHSRRPLALAVMLLTGVVAAARAQTQETPLPGAFYVPAQAEGVAHKVRKNGIEDLQYRLAEAYPAPGFTSTLQKFLETRGWSVPDRDPLNPQLSPASVRNNWRRWLDTGRSHPVEGVYVRDWQCEWQNGDGALVRYVLRYRRKVDEKEWSNLAVVSVYWPPQIVTAQKQLHHERTGN